MFEFYIILFVFVLLGLVVIFKISEEKSMLSRFRKKHEKHIKKSLLRNKEATISLGKNVSHCNNCGGCTYQLWNLYKDYVDVRCIDCRKIKKMIYTNNVYDLNNSTKDVVDYALKMQDQQIHGIIRGYLNDKIFNTNRYTFNSLRSGQPLIRGVNFVGTGQNDVFDNPATLIMNNEPKRSRRISQDVKDKVWNRDGGKCVQCGSNENLEFDHIIPFSKGGANTYRNLQLLCESCNRSKSDKIG